MLILRQGGNAPIVLDFNTDISGVSEISVSLHNAYTELAHWDKPDMEISGSSVTLPVTEAASLRWQTGLATLSCKLLDEDGAIIFYDDVPSRIVETWDKTHLTGGGVDGN